MAAKKPKKSTSTPDKFDGPLTPVQEALDKLGTAEVAKRGSAIDRADNKARRAGGGTTPAEYAADRKKSTAKMNDKDKAKVKADVIAAGGSYKELSDEEVAAKESDTKPPTPKELGTVLKETGKKPKPNVGKGMDTAQVPKEDKPKGKAPSKGLPDQEMVAARSKKDWKISIKKNLSH